MPTTLQAILNQVMGESGFTVPTSYVSSPNPDDLQLVYLANAAADEIREQGYQELIKQGSITLTAATSYALPSDFHSYVADTLHVEGRIDPGLLPTSPTDWAVIRAGQELPGETLRCRFIAGQLAVINPVSGDVVQFEYVSNAPFTDNGGTPKETATADSDLWQLDRRLLVMATKWRWKKEKGLPDWDTDLQLFQRYANGLRGRNSGARTLTFGESATWTGEPYAPLTVN